MSVAVIRVRAVKEPANMAPGRSSVEPAAGAERFLRAADFFVMIKPARIATAPESAGRYARRATAKEQWRNTRPSKSASPPVSIPGPVCALQAKAKREPEVERPGIYTF